MVIEMLLCSAKEQHKESYKNITQAAKHSGLWQGRRLGKGHQ